MDVHEIYQKDNTFVGEKDKYFVVGRKHSI